MQGESGEEALQGVGAAGGEVGPEPVAPDVFHALLVWEWRDGTPLVLADEHLVEEDEVGKAAADRGVWSLEA